MARQFQNVDKVTIQRHTRTVTCGDDVLLYTITLIDPKSKFTNYHENKITVLYNERNVEAVRDSGCTFRIEEVNSQQLNVFCFARRAGRAKVNLDLGKWYLVEDQDLVIDIVLPEELRNMDIDRFQCEQTEKYAIPLDYFHSTIKWIPEYDDILDQPVFPEDKTFQCCLRLKDVTGYSYDAKIASDSITLKYDNTEVENIKVSSCPNDVGSYNIVVPLENLEKDERSPRFWCFVNDNKIENPLILPTFTRFEKHDDDKNCVAERRRYEFVTVCYGVKRSNIIGSDFAHLNNIKRVCELDDDPSVETCLDGPIIGVVVELPFVEIANKEQKFRNILLHLLRATYYRKKAFETDKTREVWKERASENYNSIEEGEDIDKNLPHFCSQIKEKYARLMKRYHDAACEEFFKFFNAERDQSEIDLHGLLVVDEKKLLNYERQLRLIGRMSSTEVKKKIKEEHDHGNEAIRKLRERLNNYDMKKAKEKGEPWLEIIVGSGHHSKVRQRIRPKVEEFLRRRRLKFSPVNKGALVVTFEKYAGSEPCFGEYYCTKCDKRWRNGRSWIGMWQGCYDCHQEGLLKKCYPLKQRFRRKQQRYTPNIVSGNQRPFQEHLEELCEKCIELGRSCSRLR